MILGDVRLDALRAERGVGREILGERDDPLAGDDAREDERLLLSLSSERSLIRSKRLRPAAEGHAPLKWTPVGNNPPGDGRSPELKVVHFIAAERDRAGQSRMDPRVPADRKNTAEETTIEELYVAGGLSRSAAKRLS